MPVVVNEFEVLPETPPSQTSRPAENTKSGSQTKPNFNETWRDLHLRAKRVRAH
jgi:hypothetical protein